ncbi:MAG: chemotaxis protein CheX [Magnetococcales bacterium]|nr:chemotaxis protein CheX [Magnetococcales bacterium]
MKALRNENSQKLMDALQRTVFAVLDTMAMSEIEFLGVETQRDFALDGEANGVIHLTGGHQGLVGVSTDGILAQLLVGGITGLNPADLTREDLLDGMGELANMICGGMKTKSELGQIDLSAPLCLIGADCYGLWKTEHATHVMRFKVDERVLKVLASV